jgi:putative FmdB family regulatory protein
MPIYAYKCGSCGHAKDVLQKMSDAPLTTCPACQQDSLTKQVTAAGFQLKGSGWYVTDFREGGGSKSSDGTSVPKASEPAVSTVSTDSQTASSSSKDSSNSVASSSTSSNSTPVSTTTISSSTGSSNE